MASAILDLHVNPADETIRVGSLTIRFLLSGENSNGSIAAFEMTVPGAGHTGAGSQPRWLRGDCLRHRRGVDLDSQRKANRGRSGTGAHHPAWRGSPVR